MRNRTNYREIIPGEQEVFVISAMSGGFAEYVLKQIAHPDIKLKNERKFDHWSNGLCRGTVLVAASGEEREVILKIGKKEGLFLDDQYDCLGEQKKFSLKAEYDEEEDIYVMPVKGSINYMVKEKIRKRALTVANNIVGTWIIHGRQWQDRTGRYHHYPYGSAKGKRPYYDFSNKKDAVG